MTILVKKQDINETTNTIKLVVNHYIYDYLMQRINNVLQYHIFNNHWGNNLHILPLGLETDTHFTAKDIHLPFRLNYKPTPGGLQFKLNIRS